METLPPDLSEKLLLSYLQLKGKVRGKRLETFPLIFKYLGRYSCLEKQKAHDGNHELFNSTQPVKVKEKYLCA